ncbi:DDB1- and CUL4-associated factor 13 [Lycorma delicatula]|uniref:DDB1- and CUL4-associated factor 13 n=1 Tax=Lycorma delicatula TaxID=130591 RepID=UPI003F511F36
MKVKVLTRNPDVYLRETKRDLHKIHRNYDPSLHPFEAAREYVRALNAVKLERVFAKPFVGNLDGHKDGVSCIVKHPKSLSVLASGSYDGEVRLWDLSQRSCMRSLQAHEGYVRGLVFTPDGSKLLTIGDDKTIKMWDTEMPFFSDIEEPTNTIINKTVMSGITHHREETKFVTCGELCQLWEESRFEPIRSFKWGHDTLHYAAFNPVETYILGTCGSDRSIVIYDTRKVGPVRKVIMTMRSNQLCWNPMEAFIFTCANEDYNLYTYDSRNLKMPVNVHKDHVSAVTSVDYSPTGREFVSGSYDKSIRIYFSNKGHSREIYHTKRMQRVTSVLWSLDDKYVISASDEMNVRVWKARASEKLGILNQRERNALQYSEALKKKFESHPEIKRIARHRQIPKHIYKSQKQLQVQKQKIQRKEANRRKHSKKGVVPFVPERKKHVLQEQE